MKRKEEKQIREFETYVMPKVRKNSKAFHRTVEEVVGCNDTTEGLKHYLMGKTVEMHKNSELTSPRTIRMLEFLLNKTDAHNNAETDFDTFLDSFVRESCGKEYRHGNIQNLKPSMN